MIIDTETSALDHAKLGRWWVLPMLTHTINEDDKLITLDSKHLQESIDAMVAWADTAPRKHGRFHIAGEVIKKKQRELFEKLDNRWVMCVKPNKFAHFEVE